VGVGDEPVGLLAPRAEDRDDAVAGLALGDDAPRGALEALGVGDGGAPELHDDRAVVHPTAKGTVAAAGGRASPMRRLLPFLVVAGLIAAPNVAPADRGAPAPANQPTAAGRSGHHGGPRVWAAIEVLRHGGNAVDAAVGPRACSASSSRTRAASVAAS
jgi:hypothetical protein